MPKKFPKELEKAWTQYQDMRDRYMRLLRRMGEGDIEGVYKDYQSHIEYAMNEWTPPEERFEMGEYDV